VGTDEFGVCLDSSGSLLRRPRFQLSYYECAFWPAQGGYCTLAARNVGSGAKFVHTIISANQPIVLVKKKACWWIKTRRIRGAYLLDDYEY